MTAVIANPVRYSSAIFDQVQVKSDVPYRTAVNDRNESEVLKLDIYQPVGDTETGRIAVLWLHGGRFLPGTDKKQSYIVRMATEFAKRGYVGICIDFRLRTAPRDRLSILRDAVEDGRAALDWMRAQAKELDIDPRLFAIGGGSSGAALGANLVALENAVAVESRKPPVIAFINLWGSPSDDLMLAPVDRHFAPTIIVHGTADKSVPFSLSESLAAKLKSLGIRHEVLAIIDAPHSPVAHAEQFIPKTAAFVIAGLSASPPK